MISLDKHSPLRGQSALFLQLHMLASWLLLFLEVFFMSWELWDLIIWFMFFIQLYESFRVYLLNILCSLLPLGKCLFTRPRNLAPMFVFTLLLKGGLYHNTFLARFLFLFVAFCCGLSTYCIWLSYPAVWSAWLHMGVAFWKVSWLYL